MKARLFAIASLVLAGCAVMPIAAKTPVLPPSPPPAVVSAIGYIVCGKPLGFLLVFGDGRVEQHGFDDAAALQLADTVPDGHRLVLKIQGRICENNDKVI
jgi:hypothetical protein